MVEFRYRLLSKIGNLLRMSLYLTFIIGGILYSFDVPLIASLFFANLFLIPLVIYSDIYSHILFNEEGIAIKYLYSKTKILLLEHISHIEIDLKNNRQSIAIIHLQTHSSVNINLTKLKEASLFLELMKSAEINIYKDKEQLIPFNAKDLFFYKMIDSLMLSNALFD